MGACRHLHGSPVSPSKKDHFRVSARATIFSQNHAGGPFWQRLARICGAKTNSSSMVCRGQQKQWRPVPVLNRGLWLAQAHGQNIMCSVVEPSYRLPKLAIVPNKHTVAFCVLSSRGHMSSPALGGQGATQPFANYAIQRGWAQ